MAYLNQFILNLYYKAYLKPAFFSIVEVVVTKRHWLELTFDCIQGHAACFLLGLNRKGLYLDACRL